MYEILMINNIENKTFKELKEKVSNRLEWRIEIENQPSG